MPGGPAEGLQEDLHNCMREEKSDKSDVLFIILDLDFGRASFSSRVLAGSFSFSFFLLAAFPFFRRAYLRNRCPRPCPPHSTRPLAHHPWPSFSDINQICYKKLRHGAELERLGSSISLDIKKVTEAINQNQRVRKYILFQPMTLSSHIPALQSIQFE